VSVLAKVIGLLQGKSGSHDLSLDQCREIVSAYGAVLESGPVPGTVADECELPYPKQAIKQALSILLKKTTDPQLMGSLKAGYVCLSDWQPGVGPNRVGFDIRMIDLTVDALSIAKRMAATDEAAKLWLAKADEENKTLIAELREMGV
jgi:hypothetical protein